MDASLDELESCLRHIEHEWPELMREGCNPLEVVMPLLDSSSVGMAHKQPQFLELKNTFNQVLKHAVNEHFEAFNDSIGSYGITVETILESQSNLERVRSELATASSLMNSPSEVLKELNHRQKQSGDIIEVLEKISEVKENLDQIDSYNAEKNFKSAQELINATSKLAEQYGLWQIEALSGLEQTLYSQSQTLFDALLEEINGLIYFKIDGSRRTVYDEHVKSRLMKMSTSDIDDVSRAINDPLYEFIQSLAESTDEGVAPGKDVHTFQLIRDYLMITHDLGRLDEALTILAERALDEVRLMINRSSEEVRIKYPEQMELSKTTDFDIFDFSLFNNMSGTILQELFSLLFKRCLSLLQSHRAIWEISKISGFSYDLQQVWNALEKQLSSVLVSYLVDESLLDNVENASKLDDSVPYARLPRDYIANRSQPIIQFAKLSLDDKLFSTGNVQGVLNDLFSGQLDAVKEEKGSFFIENEHTAKKDLLVAPNIFNMSVIIEDLLFFVGGASHAFPQEDGKNLLKFFHNFMDVIFMTQLENTLTYQFEHTSETGLSFQRFFSHLFQVFSTSMYYRRPYVHVILRIMSKMVAKYQSLFEECVPHDLNGARSSLVSYWLNDSHLNKISLAVLDGELQLIPEEISVQLREGGKLFKLAVPQQNPRYEVLARLLESLETTLNWLPRVKREVEPVSDTGSSMTVLKANWQFMDRSSISTIENSSQTLFLALSGDAITKFDEIVASLRAVTYRIKLYIRYTVQSTAVWHVTSMLDKTNWMPDSETEEISVDLNTLTKKMAFVSNILDSIVGSDQKQRMLCGIPSFIDHLIVSESNRIIKMNQYGVRQLFLNVRVAQQMLRNVMEDPELVDFKKTKAYFEMFNSSEQGILDRIHQDSTNMFNLEDYKNLVRLVFSESLDKSMSSRSTGSYSASKRYTDCIHKLEAEFKQS
ncbi:hypothetical protein KL944_005018 [Ogataea haglerorum]|nr:hypothetical protein KL944_005018 [Ogataea haglerorum]